MTDLNLESADLQPLWISAGIVADKGSDLQQVKKALGELQRLTVAEEKGCIRFEVLQHQDEPERFTLWEGWVNESALQAHFKAKHTLAYLEQGYTDVSYIERLNPPVNRP